MSRGYDISVHMGEIAGSTLEDLIKLADQYEVDRDDMVRRFADTFYKSVHDSTFKYYKTEEQGKQ